MKTKVSLFLLSLFAFLTSTSWASMASTNAAPPIFGQDRLRTHALQSGVDVSRYVWSNGIQYDQGSLVMTNLSGAGTEKLIQDVLAVKFKYQIINTQDVIYGYVYVSDRCGTLLWFGTAEYTGAELLAGKKPKYTVYMQYQPILENVRWARVDVLDTDGQTVREYTYLDLTACNNALLPPWMSGISNANVVAEFLDGSRASYLASNPIPKVVPDITDTAKFQIEGHYVFAVTNTAPTNSAYIQVLEMLNRPTVLMDIATTQYVTLDIQMGVYDQYGQLYWVRPSRYYATPADQDEGPTTYSSIMLTGAPMPARFDQAVRLRFEWPMGNSNLLYAGPDGTGGGEKGSAMEIAPSGREESMP